MSPTLHNCWSNKLKATGWIIYFLGTFLSYKISYGGRYRVVAGVGWNKSSLQGSCAYTQHMKWLVASTTRTIINVMMVAWQKSKLLLAKAVVQWWRRWLERRNAYNSQKWSGIDDGFGGQRWGSNEEDREEVRR